MAEIDCGIDIGSTNVKVVFVDEAGRALLTRAMPSPRVNDGIGSVTDPLVLVRALESMIISGWKQLGTGRPIRTITTAGIGEDGVGVTDNLRPTGHAIPWFDKRAEAEAQELQSFAGSSFRTGVSIDPTRTAAKWLWLHRHRTEELNQARGWIALTDFPAAWWTGRPYMSSSLAPRTGCLDIVNRTWVNELLKKAHAPSMPPVLNAGKIVGGVRQGELRENGAVSGETVVVAGGHDHPIAATFTQRLDPQARIDSMGTANLIYGETPKPPDTARNEIAFSVPPSGRDGFACLGVLELSSALSAAFPDTERLKAYLAQPRLPGAPRPDSNSPDFTSRRALEDLSFAARSVLETFRQLGVPSGSIYTTGGWSRSRAFVELRASIFGEPIRSLGDLEMTAVGAALFGAEAVTGRSICALSTDDIMIVEPNPEWQSAYVEYVGTNTEG